MDYPDYMDATEQKIIDMVVKDTLDAGYYISVYGDGELDQVRTHNYALITNAVAACSQTEFIIWKKVDGYLFRQAGWVQFVHGNGCDVLVDYTANEVMESLVKRATDYAESLF